MAFNDLIDLETLIAVKRAAPQVTETPPREARMIITGLQALETENIAEQRIGMDDKPYFEAWLAEIQVYLPEALTPKRAGLICRAMGLTLYRRNQGMRIAWTPKQLEILRKRLSPPAITDHFFKGES